MANDWFMAGEVAPEQVLDANVPAQQLLALLSYDWQWLVLHTGESYYVVNQQDLKLLLEEHHRGAGGLDRFFGQLPVSAAGLLTRSHTAAATVLRRALTPPEVDEVGKVVGLHSRILCIPPTGSLQIWIAKTYSDRDGASPDGASFPRSIAQPSPSRVSEWGTDRSPYPSDRSAPRRGSGSSSGAEAPGSDTHFGVIEPIAAGVGSDEAPPLPDGDEPVAPPFPKPPAQHAKPPAFPGVLGNETEASPAPGLVVPQAPPGDRWINAVLEDHDAQQPLIVAETYTLAISIDAEEDRSAEAVGGAAASELTRDKDAALVLTVNLSSADFEIGEAQRRLKVNRDGLSAGKARFDIEPKHEGLGRLTAVIHRDNNFVQQLDIGLRVGAGVTEAQTVVSTGRPVSVSQTLSRRDIGISVRPSPAGGFDCMTWGATVSDARLPIGNLELAKEIELARQALLSVVMAQDSAGDRPFQREVKISKATSDAGLAAIALAGHKLFQKIFFGPGTDQQCHDLGNFLIDEVNNAAEGFTLQVIARDFPVPWSMLYLAHQWDPNDIDWQRFLGMKLVVEQLPLCNDKNSRDTRIPGSPNGLSVSLNLNKDIDGQFNTDVVAVQEQYWDEVIVRHPKIRVNKRTHKQQLIDALSNAATDDQIIYFYCHAESVDLNAGGGPDSSSLGMTGQESVKLGDLNLLAPPLHKLVGTPLVFINACESGELSPLFYNGFVPYFLSKGARGVIGTECKVPALFGGAWAKRFFDEFLTGMSVGELVLKLRQEFYVEHGNPLGLLYGVHCNADTQIDPVP